MIDGTQDRLLRRRPAARPPGLRLRSFMNKAATVESAADDDSRRM